MKTRLITIVLAAALWTAAGCSLNGAADSHRSAASTSSTATPPPRTLSACFTALPPSWAGTARGTFSTTRFSADAVAPAGDRAFGLFVTTTNETGIASVDLATGAMTRLVTFQAGSRGLGELAAEPPWIAWTQAGSSASLGDLTLFARNLDTGEQLTLAPPPPSGLGAAGSVAIHQGLVVWTQGTTVPGQAPTAEIHVYHLATHEQAVLDSGQVGSPVFAGRYLVWVHAGDDGSKALRSVDAVTQQPAQLPARVGADMSTITWLAGSPGYLVWTTDERHAVAWRMDRDQFTTYTVDLRNRLQFLSVAGHFLIWYTGNPTAILDLDTGGGYDLAGQAMGSEAAIVLTTPARPPTSKIDNPGTVVSVLATASAPGIPACTS